MINKVSPLSSLSPQPSLVAQNVKSQAFSSLQPGQLLQGLVTEYQGGGQAVLKTSLGQIAVQTDASLVKGQVLQLEVLSTSPQIEFGLKQDPLQTQLRTRSSFIGRSMDLGPLMQLLQKS